MVFVTSDPIRDAENYYDYCEENYIEEEKPVCPLCGEPAKYYGDYCEVCISIIDAALSMALDHLQHMLMVDREKAKDILCDRVSEW